MHDIGTVLLLEDQWSRDLESACRGEGIVSMYQPIVDTTRATIAGFEALLRFPGYGEKNPAAWFTKARELGRAADLEAAALRVALAHRSGLPRNTFLTVNVSPDLLSSPAIRSVWEESGNLAGLIVELTEHSAIESYAALEPDLDLLKERGALIAVDDAGSGYAGLQHLLALRPSFIKIDRDFISNIHHDEARRALVDMLGSFADRIDAWIIAEGVEQVEELDVLASLGVPLMQGYLLGRPALPWVGLDEGMARHLATRSGTGRAPAIRAITETALTVRDLTEAGAAFATQPLLTEVVLLAAGRPVSVLTREDTVAGAVPPGMCVNIHTPIREALARCITRDEPSRFGPVMATDDAGRFAGLVRLERLITALTDEPAVADGSTSGGCAVASDAP